MKFAGLRTSRLGTIPIARAALQNADDVALYLQGTQQSDAHCYLSLKEGSSYAGRLTSSRIVLMDQRELAKCATKQTLKDAFPISFVDAEQDAATTMEDFLASRTS
jgi:hypothetical protein